MKTSDYEQKLDAAVVEMDNVGIWRLNGMPPYFRLFQRLGFKTRPPYYVPFATIVFNYSTYFGLATILYSYVFLRYYGFELDQRLLLQAIGAGVFFGVIMAIWYLYVRKKHNLSSWDHL